MDDTLVFSWTFIMKFILAMVMLGVGIFFMHETPMKDISKAYAEQAAVDGGFTTKSIEDLKAELGKAGFDPAKLTITIQAFDRNGGNISNKVYPVTSFRESPYPTNPKFVPRGGRIILTITSSEDAAINGVSKILGGKSTITHKNKRVVMSERVR